MIKELSLTTEKTKTGYKFGMIKIIDQIPKQNNKKMTIYENVLYYKELFDKIKLINVEKVTGFKKADIVPIYMQYEFICISKKFKEIFEGKLKGYWYSTDDENYFIFLLDNCIDAIDKTKTEVKYNDDIGIPYRYEYIDNLVFKSEAKKEYLFTMKEEPFRLLCSKNFEDLVKNNNLIGFQFYKEINYKRKNNLNFDVFRNGNYDEDGNLLND